MISVSGLFETSHRAPNLDYTLLMKLIRQLTRDHSQIIQMYRLMCFDVFAHNRDDHSKNFSFLFSDETKQWKLSPAYDLTYSYSLGGEHATSLNGNGVPNHDDILNIAEQCGIGLPNGKAIMNEIETMVQQDLEKYLQTKR